MRTPFSETAELQTQEDKLLGSLGYLQPADRKHVVHALRRAEEWHRGQQRASGEPYVTHPIAVAQYLTGLEADRDTIIAALLHDVVEDERVTLEMIQEEFGPQVSFLVDGVTKLTKLRYEGRRSERQVASLRKMLLTASDDLRVIFIKLADRGHNVETLASLPQDKQERIALETLDIYVPFARIVGLWALKERFEEVCFPIAYPEESAQWHQYVQVVRERLQLERDAFVKHLNEYTSKEVQPQLIPMTDYELFQKFHGNPARLEETQQVDSVLVLLVGVKATPSDCYKVLGEIHARHPVRAISFRDYISAPQPNGYRALHTVVFLSKNHQVRLRIQTEDMREFASHRKVPAWALGKQSDIYSALASLHQTSFDKDQYISDLKQTVLAERMNVFTPAGEIIAMPQGASGIDFAFAVNPDDVSYLAGVRINGELSEATHELQDGDTVELVLLNREKAEMRGMWVDKVKSIELRETLKRSLSHSPKDKLRDEGRALLENECNKRRLPTWWLHHFSTMHRPLIEAFQQPSFDILLERVGSGHIAASKVMEVYLHILEYSTTWWQKLLRLFRLLPRTRVLDAKSPVVLVEIHSQDRPGMIYDISKAIAERKFNIARFEAFAMPPHDALYKIRLEVPNFEAFSDLFDVLLQIPNVKQVIRRY